MFEKEKEFDTLSFDISDKQVSETVSDVMRRVYGLMSVGLALTGVVAWYVYASGLVAVIAPYYLPILFVELALVFVLGRMIGKSSPAATTGMFLFYSALNGVTMSLIFAIYTLGSIGGTFLITAGMFACMSLLGFTTKTDMTKYSSFFMMGLIGFIIASIVNIWLQNPILYWVVTYAGIALFLGLTVHDTQKIKQMTTDSMKSGAGLKGNLIQRIALWGALALYLDFINLFLLLLRLFGRRR